MKIVLNKFYIWFAKQLDIPPAVISLFAILILIIFAAFIFVIPLGVTIIVVSMLILYIILIFLFKYIQDKGNKLTNGNRRK